MIQNRLTTRNRCLLVAIILSFTLVACSSRRPVLYPNERLQQVGHAGADRDINECMQRAEEYVAAGENGSKAAEQTAIGAGTGAAVGAAAGAVWGHAGVGAAAGAAGGAAAGVTRGVFTV